MGHRGRGGCLCRGVWAFVQGGLDINRGEEHSGAVGWRESGAEFGK